jgi:hypothetical protein
MTIIDVPAAGFRLAALDLYKDIHKGIRAELFAAVSAAGSLDPTDAFGRADLANHVQSVADVLDSHAAHEDGVIGPALEAHLPDLAALIHADHEELDGRVVGLRDLAATVAVAPAGDERRLTHLLYLELASFTGRYLTHQDREEQVVMPALETAVGVEAVVAMHQAIVGSIPPDEMARSLAFMLPAMNVDDRVEMLAGMREGAPREAFAGVVGLARSVLAPVDSAAALARLGLS